MAARAFAASCGSPISGLNEENYDTKAGLVSSFLEGLDLGPETREGIATATPRSSSNCRHQGNEFFRNVLKNSSGLEVGRVVGRIALVGVACVKALHERRAVVHDIGERRL